MAQLTVVGYLPSATTLSVAAVFGPGGGIVSGTATTWRTTSPGSASYRIDYVGTGFTYSSGTIPSGGTVTSIQVTDASGAVLILTVSGLSQSLTDIYDRGYGPAAGSANPPLELALFAGADSIIGNLGRDTLGGGADADTLDGAGGDDVLFPRDGSDSVSGGTGYDYVSYSAALYLGSNGVTVDLQTQRATDQFGGSDTLSGIEGVRGTHNGDTLSGNSGVNVLIGDAGNDELDGAGGNDFLWPGAGADTVTGLSGNDTVSYEDYVGAGGATINLNAGTATDPWGFNDLIIGVYGARGSANTDLIRGHSFSSTIAGLAGADTLIGVGLGDVLDHSVDAQFGGLGAAYIDLTSGFARDGWGAYDNLSGFEHVFGSNRTFDYGGAILGDIIVGSTEDNFIYAFGEKDVVFGRDGADTVFGGTGQDFVYGDAGGDSLAGEAGDDFLIGGLGADTLEGGADADFMFAADYAETTDASVDALYGGAGADVLLIGAYGRAFLDGGADNDTVYGAAGIDTLSGGAGSDYLLGFGGADEYYWRASDLTPGSLDIVGYDGEDGFVLPGQYESSLFSVDDNTTSIPQVFVYIPVPGGQAVIVIQYATLATLPLFVFEGA